MLRFERILILPHDILSLRFVCWPLQIVRVLGKLPYSNLTYLAFKIAIPLKMLTRKIITFENEKYAISLSSYTHPPPLVLQDLCSS